MKQKIRLPKLNQNKQSENNTQSVQKSPRITHKNQRIQKITHRQPQQNNTESKTLLTNDNSNISITQFQQENNPKNNHALSTTKTVNRKRAYSSARKYQENQNTNVFKIQKPSSQVALNPYTNKDQQQDFHKINKPQKDQDSNNLEKQLIDIKIKCQQQIQDQDYNFTTSIQKQDSQYYMKNLINSQDTPQSSPYIKQAQRRRLKSDNIDQQNMKSKISQKKLNSITQQQQQISQQSNISRSRISTYHPINSTNKQNNNNMHPHFKKQKRNIIQNSQSINSAAGNHMPVVISRNIKNISKSEKKGSFQRPSQQLLDIQKQNNQQMKLSQQFLDLQAQQQQHMQNSNNIIGNTKKNIYSHRNYKNSNLSSTNNNNSLQSNTISTYLNNNNRYQQFQHNKYTNPNYSLNINNNNNNTISLQSTIDHSCYQTIGNNTQSNQNAQLFQSLSIEKYMNKFSYKSGVKRRKKTKNQQKQSEYDQNNNLNQISSLNIAQNNQNNIHNNQEDEEEESQNSENGDKMTMTIQEFENEDGTKEEFIRKKKFSKGNITKNSPQGFRRPSIRQQQNSRNHSRNNSTLQKQGTIIQLQQQQNQSFYSEYDEEKKVNIENIDNPVLNQQNLHLLPGNDKFFSTENLLNTQQQFQQAQNTQQIYSNNIMNITDQQQEYRQNIQQQQNRQIQHIQQQQNLQQQRQQQQSEIQSIRSFYDSNMNSFYQTRGRINTNNNYYHNQPTDSGLSAFQQTGGFNNEILRTNPGSDEEDQYFYDTQQGSQDQITQI